MRVLCWYQIWRQIIFKREKKSLAFSLLNMICRQNCRLKVTTWIGHKMRFLKALDSIVFNNHASTFSTWNTHNKYIHAAGSIWNALIYTLVWFLSYKGKFLILDFWRVVLAWTGLTFQCLLCWGFLLRSIVNEKDIIYCCKKDFLYCWFSKEKC